jgi:hypothetical protein
MEGIAGIKALFLLPAPTVSNKWPNTVKTPVNHGLQGHTDVDHGHSLAGKPATIPYFLSNNDHVMITIRSWG